MLSTSPFFFFSLARTKFRSVRSSGDDGADQEVFKKTLEGRDAGCLRGEEAAWPKCHHQTGVLRLPPRDGQCCGRGLGARLISVHGSHELFTSSWLQARKAERQIGGILEACSSVRVLLETFWQMFDFVFSCRHRS